MNTNLFASDIHLMLILMLIVTILIIGNALFMAAYVGLEKLQLSLHRMHRRRDRKLPTVQVMTWLRVPKLKLSITRR